MYHVSNSTHTVKLKSLWCTPEYLPHSSWNLFYFNPNHRFHLCVHYSMCRCVKITPRCVNKLISLPVSFVFFFFRRDENGSSQLEEKRHEAGKGCVTGLEDEDLPQPLSSEWLRRFQGAQQTPLFLPSTKPSTWASQDSAPLQDEEREENTCFTVSSPVPLQLG